MLLGGVSRCGAWCAGCGPSSLPCEHLGGELVVGGQGLQRGDAGCGAQLAGKGADPAGVVCLTGRSDLLGEVVASVYSCQVVSRSTSAGTGGAGLAGMLWH